MSVPPREKLVKLYHDEGKSMSTIADIYNVNASTVHRWMRSHNVETRNRGESAPANLSEKAKKLRDKQWLKTQLHDEIKHPDDIADELGYSAATTVWRWMDNHDLSIIYKDKDALRSAIRDRYLTPQEIADELGRSRQTIIKWANKMDVKYRPWQYEPVLRELREQGMSTYEIGEKLGCTGKTVSIWLNKFDMDTSSIDVYTDEELLEQIEDTYDEHGFVSKRLFEYKDDTASVSAVRNHFGSWSKAVEEADIDETANHQTDNDSVPDEYRDSYGRNRSSLYKRRRQKTLERDGYQCQICYSGADEKELHIHHINPMQNFDDQDNAHTLDNLVTLCKDHHRQVEANNIDCPDPPES